MVDKRPCRTKAIWEGRSATFGSTRTRANGGQHPLGPVRPGQPDPAGPAVPVMIKLRAKTRWLAMDAASGAEGAGQDQPTTPSSAPQSELDARRRRRRRLAAKKVAGAKAVAVEREEEEA